MPPPLDNKLLDITRRYWGFDTLRPLQAEAIQATLDRRDSLVVMPTGGGKSLCYQVPPLITGDLCVVVSPLIALMKDQVDALRVAGYPAAALHSNLSAAESAKARDLVNSPGGRLLLVAPERLLSEGGSLLTWLKKIGVGSFAIDEAHCISQWGHDFRPEYRRLAELREHFPGVALHAYTATATPRVREDIVKQLHLHDPAVLVGRFDRPNLTYRILPRLDMVDQVADALGRHKDRAAIVYCITRKDTEFVATTLRTRGIDARAYHAGLDAAARNKVSDDFRTERLSVVVATVAFGMGIDRGDVRCVVHASMPKSVEHYQQETGRAGRDGLPSECLLLYSGADFMKWKQILEFGIQENQTTEEVFQAQLELLNHVQRLCSSTRCRHKALSEYFGQQYEPPPLPAGAAQNGAAGATTGPRGCRACDVCLSELDTVPDSMDIARKIISCVARAKESFGAAHIADVLRGSTQKKILDWKHDQLSTFGLLKDKSREAVLSYINQLLDAGVLDRAPGEFPVLRLNAASAQVLRNQLPVTLVRPKRIDEGASGSGGAGIGYDQAAATPLTPEEARLFESLRGLRRQVAESLGVPPFVVFGDATLEELARVRPGSRDTLINVRGIGTAKLAEFGDRFLAHIREYCAANNLALDAVRGSRPRSAKRASSEARPLTASRLAAAKLFAAGVSIEDAALKLDRARSTVTQYLVEYIMRERPKSIAPWVDEATYKRVRDAASTAVDRRFRTVFEKLAGEVTYDQIRLVVNHLKSKGEQMGYPDSAGVAAPPGVMEGR